MIYDMEQGEWLPPMIANCPTVEILRVEYVEGKHTVFYSDLACFENTLTLNMCVVLSYTGLARRNTRFVVVWLRHRNT